jgi:DNA-directed RNA polymerase subunit RPC12/RpoP
MPHDGGNRWPCEGCGSDLTFVPGQTALVCAHCGHAQAIPPAPASERQRSLGEIDLAAALADALPEAAVQDLRVVKCPACAAEIEWHGATHASVCPFCDTPLVADPGLVRHIRPQALIPFRLSEREARAAMVRWLGRLWFAPNGLRDYARKGRALTGIYVPYWTFDAATRSRYRGQRGDAYFVTEWVTVTVDGRPRREPRQVRKLRWTPVSGWVSRRFDDVLVLASTALPRRHTDALAPWHLGALEPYRADYLAGFEAESYTIGLAEGRAIARQVMAGVIEGDVRRAIGGDEQRIDRIDTVHSAETFKHILLPVWTAAYKYGGRSYRFVVNGQTGKVQGERPWSIWKIALAVLAALLALGGLLLLTGELPPGLLPRDF